LLTSSQSDTSVSEINEKCLDDSWQAIYDAPSAVDVQQALLDYADDYAGASDAIAGIK
jgi:hypothetical protein